MNVTSAPHTVSNWTADVTRPAQALEDGCVCVCVSAEQTMPRERIIFLIERITWLWHQARGNQIVVRGNLRQRNLTSHMYLCMYATNFRMFYSFRL